MIRRNVFSTSLRSVGYDAANEVPEIHFVSNAIYLYFKVLQHMYHGLMEAPSIGRDFAETTRNRFGAYRVR